MIDKRESKKRRAVAVLALALAFLTLFSSCGKTGPGGGTPAESDSFDRTPSETPAESSPEETPAESGDELVIDPSWEIKEALDLVAGRICEYTLVRPELMGDALQQEVMELKKELGKLSKDPVKIAEDWLNPFTNQQPEELEIIVGDCDRAETKYVLSGLKYNDWAVEIVGKKLVIVGHTEENTVKAIGYIRQFLYALNEGDDFIFLPEDCKINRADYKINDITVVGGEACESSVRKYKIVIPNLCGAVEKNAASELAEQIAYMTGYAIDVVKDSTEETEFEILIGKTTRALTAEVYDSLRYYDGELRISGGKIAVLGYMPEKTAKMCDTLLDIISAKAAKSKNITLAAEDGVAERYTYQADSLSINGNDIRTYSIIYHEGDELSYTVATNLNRAIIGKIGISLEVISDKATNRTEREIIVGSTSRTAAFDGDPREGIISVTDKYVYIDGGRSGGFGKAVGEFINQIFPEKISGDINIELAPSETLWAETESVKVMSYNILTWPTAERLDQIVTIINDYAPDVIGMQEAVPSALAELKKRLGDTYDCVYLERDNASGESTPVWYNKNKYNLIESGSGWLSETPDTMSKLSTSEYYRVYVYVVLENKETGARFVHVNTHLDFARAQQSQVSILLNETAHLSYMPMFYTADWNFTPGEMGYKMMHAAGYTDASVMTDNVDGGGTIIGGGEIDFCFAAIQSTSVDGYMVVDDHEFSETSSDHYPILVDLNIIK